MLMETKKRILSLLLASALLAAPLTACDTADDAIDSTEETTEETTTDLDENETIDILWNSDPVAECLCRAGDGLGAFLSG